MLRCIDELKLNKFRAVSVPRNRDLYARVGGRVPQLGTGGFTSEIAKSKLDIIADSEDAINAEYQQSLKKKQIPLAETLNP